MGDGALVEFASVVDAVSCAVEIQRAMEARNRDSPVTRRIEYRIGVNVGDIIAEGSDIYGHGVNVTARLEALAAPGGICISRGVYDQVRDKLMLTFEDLGDQLVKNIARPVRVFRISLGTQPGSKASATRPGPNPQQQSIAVLPFANVSGDPDQAFFADGITEDIITALSRFRSLKVAACNSSFAYKGRSVDVRQVSRELVTDYIVEGSVRRVGNRVRITAQLIQGTTDRHIWAEKFDRDLGDIFNVQDEITRVIVGTIVHKVDTEETERRTRGWRADRDALDCYLVGRDLFFGRTRDSNERALALIEMAIELAPGLRARPRVQGIPQGIRISLRLVRQAGAVPG
jgi:adenylate cyclase